MTPAEVRAARERLGLTTQQLATALECTVRAVQQWESGVRNVPGPARVALRMMVTLNCSVIRQPPARSRRPQRAGTSAQCAC